MEMHSFDFQIVKNALRFRLFFPLSQYVKNYIFTFNSAFITKRTFLPPPKKKSNTNTYLVFVQSNGSGHFTQMMQIIEILKPNYECIGIVASYEKANVTKYANDNKLPLFNLKEPNYMDHDPSLEIVIDGFRNYLDNYTKLYGDLSDFVDKHFPQFVINLHCPLILHSFRNVPIFNISTQNRWNMTYCRQELEKLKLQYPNHPYMKAEMINGILLSCYAMSNSYPIYHTIKIDTKKSLKNNIGVDFSLPPLINFQQLDQEINTRKNKNLVLGYFHRYPPGIECLETFIDIQFHIFILSMTEENPIKNVTWHKPSYEQFAKFRKQAFAFIGSCGCESVYEAYYLNIPIFCVPSNPEQVLNAIDHSSKIDSFFWDFKINVEGIQKLIDYIPNDQALYKHYKFTYFVQNGSKALPKFIQTKIHLHDKGIFSIFS